MRVVREIDEHEFVLDGPPLAQGGEAAVYPVPGEPGLAAKIYHRPTPEHAAKLAALLAARPPDLGSGHLSVAWPTDRLLAADGGSVVGCLMPRVSGARPLCELSNPRARSRTCPLFHYGYLLRTARNLAAAVRALHECGHVLGDLNESNVLVTPRALVTLVDTDSFQLSTAEGVYRCRVGRPEYTPPELQAAVFGELDRQPEHDAFALAVLIFQLLMQGVHPFAGRFTGAGELDPLPERIRAGYWPYALGRDGPFQPVPYAPPWEVLPPPVAELFLRCFEEGHGAPERRPSAADWRQALDAAGAALTACPASTQHHYPRGLDGCPWCALARQQDRDPFPTLAEVKARRTSRSVLAPEAAGLPWGAGLTGEAPGLDPTDPLPPPANGAVVAVPEVLPTAVEQRPAAAPAGQTSWSSWLAVAAMSALIGVLLVLWRHQGAPPVRAAQAFVEHPATTESPEPEAPAPTPQRVPERPPAVPVPLPQQIPEGPPAVPVPQPSLRPPQVFVPRKPRFPSPAQAARSAAALKAERAWKEAVAELKQAQQEHQRFLEECQAARAAAIPGLRNDRLLFWLNRARDQQRLVMEKWRIVQERTRLWQEARAALVLNGP